MSSEPEKNTTKEDLSSPRKVPLTISKSRVTFVSPGVVDSEGFLAPPPQSTLLIRRTKTNNSSTYEYESHLGRVEAGFNAPGQKASPIRRDGSVGLPFFDRSNQHTSALASLEDYKLRCSPGDDIQLKIPKLCLKRVNVKANLQPPTLLVNKRGPRGKYKKKNKNVDVYRVKRPYTKNVNADRVKGPDTKCKLTDETERKLVDHDSPLEKSDCENDDASDGRKPCLSDNGIWRPTDDLRLISNVIQTCNLQYVHIGVKFSCVFTLEDIKTRWKSLMYDEKISNTSKTAVRKLHPLVKNKILSAVLFNDKEEDLLKAVNEDRLGNENLIFFEKLLEDNKDIFYKTRTPKSLFDHWLRLKELSLLDANIERPPLERFESFEMEVDDKMLLKEPYDAGVFREWKKVKRDNVRKIKKLEKEVKHLQILVDNIVLKDNIVETESVNYLAIFKGEKVRHLMNTHEITFGRKAPNTIVDIDLQLEGSSEKVSRIQGKISLEDDGQFQIQNLGKNAIIVNAKPLRPFTTTSLEDQATIMIANLSFVFEINKNMLEHIRRTFAQRIKPSKKKDLKRRNKRGIL